MAVVTLKYTRARPHLKSHLRYITHRRGREEGRITRQLFNAQGLTDRASVYELIDAAARGTVFYKFMISPDPNKEDIQKDLDLRHITRQTILALERQLGLRLPFAAVLHPADHSALRHAHGIFLLPRRLSKTAFRTLQRVAVRAATAKARLQRRARDRVREHPRNRSLPLSRALNHYQRHQQAHRIGHAFRIGQPRRSARGIARGYNPSRLQSGCRACGYGLVAGISGFLPLCPSCGRRLTQQRKPQLSLEVSR